MKEIQYFQQPVSRITKLLIGVNRYLVDTRTAYQHVIIAELIEYGLSLILDDLIQVAEVDEAYYHESLVHPALIIHEDPRNVLIIGGGDGCALREVLKHNVERATLVDIDGELVEICKKYLIKLNKGSLEDSRAKIFIMDGREFVDKTKESYDCIILDLTDPFGPEISKELYSYDFYKKISEIMEEKSILITQAGSAFYYGEVFEEVRENIKKNFKHVLEYETWIPSFGYSCCFIMASNSYSLKDFEISKVKERIEARNIKTKFYDPTIHEVLLKKPLTRANLNLLPSKF